MKKRIFTRLSAIVLSLSFLFTGCATASSSTTPTTASTAATSATTTAATTAVTTAAPTEATTTEATTTEAPTQATEPEASEQFVLEYTPSMQAKGYEAMVFDTFPENIVALTNSVPLTFWALGVDMIAARSSTVAQYPAEMLEEVELIDMAGDTFDMETVVVMEPGIVFMPEAWKDTYGAICDSADIPVYYMETGHANGYSFIKEQTELFIDAFAKDTEEGEALRLRLADFEAMMAEAAKKYEGQTYLALRNMAEGFNTCSDASVLGSMLALMGFENLLIDQEAAFVPVDYEMLLSYDPDYVFAQASGDTLEEAETAVLEQFSTIEGFWERIPAIIEGDITYLPTRFNSGAGLQYLTTATELLEIIEAQYGN